ncbi:GTP-binding protein [Halomonas halocynthiae]|uniref:GTP-binding protein n=1 Tax=Halomonas halocynthiae TaxID=176290 RepID=UPI00040855BE|nr:GTP-binding protein [Halomonas halocynthiae]
MIDGFDDINIDVELIDHRDDQVIQLANGCICCTLAEQLICTGRTGQRFEALVAGLNGLERDKRVRGSI